MNNSRSLALLQKMKRVMPGGVSSNIREGVPIVIARGEGAEVVDVDGNRYIDYQQGFGPVFLGHGHPAVTEAVSEALQQGTTFALSTELEYQVCAKIVEMCPAVEMVRLCNSGTDASVSAYRIAAAVTGAAGVVKIQGDYNGGFDPLLYDVTGVDGSRLGRPTCLGKGLLPASQDIVSTLPFNDLPALEKVLRTRSPRVAAVFLEPILGNAAAIMPLPGYLKNVRALCREYGALLVFDEVKTGFRVHPGGAQALLGIEGDLTMYGKALANGLPLAAIGGRQEYMELLRAGDVHHCGTYYGNRACVAAANAVLTLLSDMDYEQMHARGERLANGICAVLAEAGREASWQGVGSMFGITLGPATPTDYGDWWMNTDHLGWQRLALQMRELGVLTDAFIGLQFLSFAHTDEHVQRTLDVCRQAVQLTEAGKKA